MDATDLDLMQYYTTAVNDDPECPARRKKILIASLPIFAEKGFTETTMTDVAKAAQVNVADVELHFPSKQRLLNAILEELITEALPLMINDFTASTMTDNYSDLETFLTAMVSDRLAFVRINLPILKLINTQVSYNQAFQTKLTTQLVPMITDNLAGVLDQLAPQRPHNVTNEQIKQFIYGAISAYFLQLVGGAKLDEAEQTKLIVQRFKILLGAA